RSPDKDGARHKDLELGKMDHANFFNILMHMFPSPDGELSIDPAGYSFNSFTKFLKSENIKKHAHTLLAMLLLRTEGIEVPLELNRSNKKFLTVTLRKVCIDDKENTQKTGCIQLNLYNLHCKKQNHTTNQLEYFNKTHILDDIICYITRTCTNLQVNAYRKAIEGDLKKEFWDKYFISSPNWLIQSYIHHYLKTKEEAACFNRTVYKMLSDHINECKKDNQHSQKQITEGFFRRCFVPKCINIKTATCWKMLKELEDLTICPEKARLLPPDDFLKLFFREEATIHIHNNAYLEKNVFLTDVESTLLGMFCCFAYEPESNTYNLDHIPNAPQEAKDFFSRLSCSIQKPFDEPSKVQEDLNKSELNSRNLNGKYLSKEMLSNIHMAWSKIVRNIKDDDVAIHYMALDNGSIIIKSDILNILTIILKLVGRYEEEKRKIEYLKVKVAIEHPFTHENRPKYLIECIEQYASTLFSSLSRNCVPCANRQEWRGIQESDVKRRHVFVEIIAHKLEKDSYLPELYGNMEIYYANKSQAHALVMHAMTPKISYLKTSMPAIKIDKSTKREISIMKSKMRNTKIDKFSKYTLFDYAQHIEEHRFKNYRILDADKVTYQSLKSTNILSNQPLLQVLERVAANTDNLIGYIKDYIDTLAKNNHPLSHCISILYNMALDHVEDNIELQLLLILCIGYNDK
ncbi:hypothetical protein NEAUS03_2415, partial [Nematocida ausubeli]